MEATTGVLTVSGILFGFLFAGFWWGLNRELEFEEDSRHFKPGFAILIVSMVALGYWGIVLPLRTLAKNDPALLPSYRGILVALIGILGYMITELGHYSVFQKLKYSTAAEWVVFAVTTFVIVGVLIWWLGQE